jgi:hypothetical protein
MPALRGYSPNRVFEEGYPLQFLKAASRLLRDFRFYPLVLRLYGSLKANR